LSHRRGRASAPRGSPTSLRAATPRTVPGQSLGSGVGTRDEFETASAQHQGKPAIIRDQRTRPVNKIDNFAKSAKPPSPVQIRAAPPFFRANSMVCAAPAQSGRANCLELCSGRRARPLQVADMADGWRSDDLEGRGLQDLRLRPLRPASNTNRGRPLPSDSLRTDRPVPFAATRCRLSDVIALM
jgi:hypothetical protein